MPVDLGRCARDKSYADGVRDMAEQAKALARLAVEDNPEVKAIQAEIERLEAENKEHKQALERIRTLLRLAEVDPVQGLAAIRDFLRSLGMNGN
jgi:ferric-dicitrate binding protein FerR (iron transport regulator)